MCNPTAIAFGTSALVAADLSGKRVLEVGARDVNGSLRPHAESFAPARYIGVDIKPGAGVDELLDATRLLERFGPNSFDVVIATEIIEHVRDWRTVIDNIKSVVRPGGIVLITTRSLGFHYHGYPYDYWRYEPEDMEAIFADWDIERLERDAEAPGVFMLARKRSSEIGAAPSLALYSVVSGRRQPSVSTTQIARLRALHGARRLLGPGWSLLPPRLRAAIKIRVLPYWSDRGYR